MRRSAIHLALIGALLGSAGQGLAQGNLEIDTPAIAALRASMQQRHQQIVSHYESGTIGLTRDGLVAIRDASQVPLAQRSRLSALVAAENRDREALYREIARANGHPEWGGQVQATFAQRWIDKARRGWWVQQADKGWAQR
ncbi:MAG: YdbL family protein [Rhodocyclaceae bacterium]|nr:YdbL family protein [Rhodocyclaceae bacterium]